MQESRLETRAGRTKLSEKDVKNLLFNFAWWMKKQGYRPSSVHGYPKRLRTIINRGAHLTDPEQTKGVIAAATVDDGTKKCWVDAYALYAKMQGIQWTKPRYTVTTRLPFIPTEKELDHLIYGTGKKMRAFLLGLKLMAPDTSELLNIEWTDVDFKRKKVVINHPCKGHDSRILGVSDEWLSMVSMLPRISEKVWTCKYGSHYNSFTRARRRLAQEYGNPRLNQITFRTFRHWAATMHYHRCRSIMHTKEFLGHKSVKNTEIYVHIHAKLFGSKQTDYIVRRTRTIKGCLTLAAAGFTKFDELNGIHLYKKVKATTQ